MTNTIKQSDKSAVSLRKFVGLLSIIVAILTVVLMCVGFIPLFHRKASIMNIGYGLFEILSFEGRSFFFQFCNF